jgi:hypothetical protein
MWRIGRVVGLFYALLVAPCLDVWAQTQRVGYVDEVTGLASDGACTSWRGSGAARDSIAIVREGREWPAWPKDSAVLLDRFRVGRFSDLRFRVDQPRFGAGTFYFTPELGRCAGIRGIESPTGHGSYRLSSRREMVRGQPMERLVLSVDNGGAIVEWTSGRLSVIALGREIRDSGTVFAVVVDSAAGRALLYVSEGLVSIAGAQAVRAAAGRAFAFGRTGSPEPFTPSEQLVGDATYQSRVVWTQVARGSGFPWRTVGVVGGSAAIVGGYFVWRNNHQDRPTQPQGTIRVHVPL